MTKVATASNAGRGDSVAGNFDLTFVLDQAFDFAGGGLAIRFDYVGTDPDTWTNEPRWATTDGSAYAVEQFYTNGSSYGDRDSIIAAARFNDELARIQEPSEVPEPATLALFGLAFLVMRKLRQS